MEKFKRHTDHATGVNPFVITQRPAALAYYLNFILFPIRILLAAVICLILIIIEMPLHVLRNFGLSFIGRLVFHPVISVLVRLQLLLAANMVVSSKPFPARPTVSVYSSVAATRDKTKPVDDSHDAPRAGEIVVCNMQCPLDILALMSLGTIGGWSIPTALVAFPLPNGTTMEMKPSPFQKVKYMRHCLWTGAESFFKGEKGDAASIKPNNQLKIDVTLIQQRAKRLGVPVLYFAEGTCANGKGMMNFPPFACEGTVHLVSLHYNTQIVNTVTKDRVMGGSKFLFNVGTAGLGLTKCTAMIVRPSNIPAADTTFSDSWANNLRSKMCAANSSLDTRVGCKPVGSGFVEKAKFIEHWWTAKDGKAPPSE